MPRRAALLHGFSSLGINRYVDVIMSRSAEVGKLRLPLRRCNAVLFVDDPPEIREREGLFS